MSWQSKSSVWHCKDIRMRYENPGESSLRPYNAVKGHTAPHSEKWPNPAPALLFHFRCAEIRCCHALQWTRHTLCFPKRLNKIWRIFFTDGWGILIFSSSSIQKYLASWQELCLTHFSPPTKSYSPLLTRNSFTETRWFGLCFTLPSVADLAFSLRQTDKAAAQRNQVSKRVIYEADELFCACRATPPCGTTALANATDSGSTSGGCRSWARWHVGS